jgi:hypothetical protein
MTCTGVHLSTYGNIVNYCTCDTGNFAKTRQRGFLFGPNDWIDDPAGSVRISTDRGLLETECLLHVEAYGAFSQVQTESQL